MRISHSAIQHDQSANRANRTHGLESLQLTKNERNESKHSIRKKIRNNERSVRIENINDSIGEIDLSFTTCASYPGTIKAKRLQVNVGGRQHEISRRTIRRFPSSRLHALMKAKCHDEIMELCDDYDLAKSEFYFDRNTEVFSAILEYYRTGKLHLPIYSCASVLEEELVYWRIFEWQLEPCCRDRYQQQKEESLLMTEMENERVKLMSHGSEDGDTVYDQESVQNVNKTCFKKYKRFCDKIWTLFEKPNSSNIARAIAIVSVTFILLSTVVLCVGTVKDMENKPSLTFIEGICIAWFTFEYVVRFVTSPNKLRFIISLLNTIDLIAILPYYIGLIINAHRPEVGAKTEEIARVLLLTRMLRVFRVLKLARHSSGLQVLGLTLKTSWRELFLLNLFLTIGVTIFSGFVYYAEKDVNNTTFVSIPATFWWGYITMTTVGYGDAHPVTPAGQFLGILCCITGVLVVALPIPIIFNNFNEIYSRRKKEMKFFTEPVWFKKRGIHEKLEQFSDSSTSDDDDEIVQANTVMNTRTLIRHDDITKSCEFVPTIDDKKEEQLVAEKIPESQNYGAVADTDILDHNQDVNDIRFQLMQQLGDDGVINTQVLSKKNFQKHQETIL